MPVIKQINAVRACRAKNPEYCQISTNNDFFKKGEYIIVKILPGKIIFQHPTIDYQGKLYKISTNKRKSWKFFAINISLNPGLYPFDEEESNEDQKVIFINNNDNNN